MQLLEKQMLSNDRLSTSYAILKVTKYKPGAKKERLPYPKWKRSRKR